MTGDNLHIRKKTTNLHKTNKIFIKRIGDQSSTTRNNLKSSYTKNPAQSSETG